MNLCVTCRKFVYRTDPCKGFGVVCGRTDGGSTKSSAPIDRGPFPRVEVDAGPDLKVTYSAKRKIPKADRLAAVKEVAQKLADKGIDVKVVDKPKRGRPKSIIDMRTYKREKQQAYRAKAKP